MAPRSKKTRDYKAEYKTRIARGAAQGKSRSQARGHARANEGSKKVGPASIDRGSKLEQALKSMKRGASQKKAAKEAGVSAESLRRYQKENTTSHREGHRWIIRDTRAVSVVMATRGKLREVTVPRDAASDIAHHFNALDEFLNDGDPSHLKPFVGLGIRDTKGNFHPFETRPNVLRKLDSIGELSFVDIYRQTVQ